MILGLALAFYIAWCIGTNDAANPTQMAVGSGALRINKAIILFAAFALIGATLQGWMVIKTFGKGIAQIPMIYDALASTIATAIWITLSSYKGMPVSTTQSSVGAVLGIGLYHAYLIGEANSIHWDVLIKVFISWITSPLGGMFLAAALYFPFKLLRSSLQHREGGSEKFLKVLVIVALAFSAYAFGSNDVGNATGVYYSTLSSAGTRTGFDYRTALGLATLAAVGVAIGGFTLGKRVIATIAFKLTKLDLVTGAAEGYSTAFNVWLFTTIPTIIWGFGMPVSTTHAAVSAVLGVGLAKYGIKGVDWRMFGKILVMWLLTVPAAAALSLALREFTHLLIGV